MEKTDILQKIVEAPATALDNVASEVEIIENKVTDKSLVGRGVNYIKHLGPGLVSGAADDDPSGIATYSQAGAQFGTSMLWLAAWTFPLMATIQEMCARIALVTGRGLAANMKHSYSRRVLYFATALLFIANTLNIGANLGAMAKAIQLIFPFFNFVFLIILIGLTCLLLQVFITYKSYAKYLKWLAITLLAYVATGLIIHMDWARIIYDGLVPHITFSKENILLITGVLGTTISPYLFFWQTSQEVEEEISIGKTTAHSRRGANDDEIKNMRVDIWSGMFLSNLVMFFIIAVCATTLYANGITNINTAADAAEALRPLAGNAAYLLFALGIIGTGMLAVPVLAGSTAYAISESLGYKEGLYRKLAKAKAFYGIIIISVVLGIIINFIGIDPIKALIYSAIANGIVAPVILVCIVHMSGSHKIMGKYKNSKLKNVVGWTITAVMTLAAIGAIISMF
ncbi:Nramp family divalent metal transporter [Candidatus Nomurabacteria bacterium]|nr:Nramp family divalent metal transporter [Candidatus Nomurabacteria bacterium]